MNLGLTHFTDRVGEGIGLPRLNSAGGEELVHVEPGAAIALACRSPESPGTLYISTRRVIWLSDTDRDKGYAVDFLSISLHAVSRDPETYPSPCIYTQIEAEAAADDESGGSDAECCDETDVSKITEMRLIPYDPNQLDTLFDIFCQCVELNPEPLEGEDEESSWVFGDEGSKNDGDQPEGQLSDDLPNPIGHANGHHDLAHSVLHLLCESFLLRMCESYDLRESGRSAADIGKEYEVIYSSNLMINALRMQKKWKMLLTIRIDSALFFNIQERKKERKKKKVLEIPSMPNVLNV